MAAAVRESVSARALERFRDALGADGVVSDRDALREFRDPYAYPSWEEHTASAMVMPRSVEQVQAVVRIAGECGVSLWTFSQGRNYGYGGPAPRVGGSVLVNLRGMDRILEIDEELAYALVEPGVRFFDLYEAIGQAGYRLWPSIPDLGWGSIVGNTLDHGVGFTPLGDHPARQCGMEVVLADGDVLRTGMGGVSGSRAWQTAKRGFGPSLDSLFMQSNFGIVTKMGVWLMPEPECYASCTVRVPREEDLAPLVDTVRSLLLQRIIENTPITYNMVLVAGAMSGVGREHWYEGEGAMTDQALARMADTSGVGWWIVRFALYGREELVEVNYEICRAAFERIPGARVERRTYEGSKIRDRFGEPTPPPEPGYRDPVEALGVQSDRTQAGVPGLELLDSLSWDETGGHLDYSPIGNMIGEEALAQSRLLRQVCAEHGFDYAASLMMSPRSFINIVSLWFDLRDETQVRKAYDFVRVLIKRCGPEGYAPYRTHLAFMDDAAELFDWGDHAQRRFLSKLKDALDPAGILSPGKQGIWPQDMGPRTHH